jgi:hypothetical protein
MGRRAHAEDLIVERIPDGGRFGVFATRPPAEHLVLGVCDLGDALGFVVASTNDHPLDTGPIAVLDPGRLTRLTGAITGWLVSRRANRGANLRYVVHAGPSVLRAYVVDTVSQQVILTLQGPDRYAMADGVAAVLNSSAFEVPVAERRELTR